MDHNQTWTRRHALLGASLFPLGLPALTQAQVLKARAATHPIGVQPGDDTVEAERDAANRMTIEVMINDRGPYVFVVDTGAERSVVANTVAEALGLPRQGTVTVDGFTSRVNVPLSPVESLTFGKFRHENLLMPVLERVPLGADGYLGLDVLDNRRVTFDFAHHLIRIEPSEDAAPEPEAGLQSTRVIAHGAKGRLRITDCRVDSIGAVAFIDTGAEVSVGNVSLKNAMRSRNVRLQASGTATLTGVTGGEIEGEIIPVERIRLRNLMFSEGTLVIANVPDFATWKARYRPALLIGMDYLRQFSAVVVDFGARDIRFDLAAVQPFPSPEVSITQQG